MAFGKLYAIKGNPRTIVIQVVAKENNLDLDFVETDSAKAASTDYLKLNKQGLIPTFEGADGYVLTECIAIAIYITSQNEKTTLLGKTKQDYASILRWMSFANASVLPSLAAWVRPILGKDPYNKKNSDAAQAETLKVMKILDEHLLVNTYLVGERFTLADIFVASLSTRGFEVVFDKAWRAEYPSVARWYETIRNQSNYKAVAGDFSFISEARKYTPPAKAPKAEAPKQAAKPKAVAAAAAADDEEEEAAPAPKPKHPLEALGRSTFVLDDWKRKYSNAETREDALPWFWKEANFEEYSLWQVDYKYNDELTMTFMTSNLIGGFFTRLEASRKYIFGAASVYGVTNDSIVKGAFYIRGQDATPAFDVAPDSESYAFKKLDPKNSADREFVDDMWAWDKPIVVDGKTYEWADGKVLHADEQKCIDEPYFGSSFFYAYRRSTHASS